MIVSSSLQTEIRLTSTATDRRPVGPVHRWTLHPLSCGEHKHSQGDKERNYGYCIRRLPSFGLIPPIVPAPPGVFLPVPVPRYGCTVPEPELSFGWRLTAGSRPGTRRRSPPKTADLSSDDGTDSQLHFTPSKRPEDSASALLFAQSPTSSAPGTGAQQTLRRRRHRHDDRFCFTRPASPLRAYSRFVHAF